MAMATKIIIFLLIFASCMQLYCMFPLYGGATCPYTGYYNTLVQGVTLGDLQNLIFNSTTAGIVIAIIGTVIFPNPYVIFFGIAVAIGGLVQPGGVIDSILSNVGLPTLIMQPFTDSIKILFVFAVIAWYGLRDLF
jgi:hypothetical protein